MSKVREDYFREVETRVIEATALNLMKFSHKELRDYAKSIGVQTGQTKAETVSALCMSGKATMLAQLGN